MYFIVYICKMNDLYKTKTMESTRTMSNSNGYYGEYLN